MDKKALSESDICDKFIRPAIEAAGWDGLSQIYREYAMHAGRVVVCGRKARRDAATVLRADYAPSKTPRYFQLNAINRTVEAIALGRKRVLLVMATDTAPRSRSSGGCGRAAPRSATSSTSTARWPGRCLRRCSA